MAKLYDENFSKSLMSFGKSFSRLNGQPLDDSSVYFSYAEAVEYAASASAYVGQPIAVIDKANNTAKLYLIENEAGGLQEIGANVEFEDTNTTYSLSFTRQEETAEDYAGTIVKFVSSDENEEDIEFFIPDAYDDSELVGRISELEDKVSQKVDRVDVYTTAETDKKIGEAIASADHLKRKIIETIEYEDEASSIVDIEKTILNSLSKDEAGNYIDVDKYIYMIPIGPVEDDNKYYEYIAIDISDSDVPEYLFEKVGSWEVNLDGYVINDTLKDYALKSEIPTDYVTTTEIANYETAATAEGKYVAKEDGKSLIADTEIERLAKVNENAEVNYIKSVDENRFTVTEVGKLELNNLADYVKVIDATADNGLRFINQVEINKLSKLNLDGEDITISGSVNASQVKELYATVANIVKGSTADLDPDTEGFQLGLGIQEGAQVNFIDNINTDVFSIDSNKKLDLVTVPVGKLNGLEDWIEENRNVVAGLYPTAAVTLLDNLDNAINNEETGLIAKLTAVDSRLITVETSISNHADRLGALEYAMTWRDIEENI